jgi:hypothetical protein
VPSTSTTNCREESPAEQLAQGLRPANHPWQATALAPDPKPSSPILPTYTFSLSSPSESLRSSSPQHPTHELQSSSGAVPTMAGESAEKTNSGCPVILEWWSMYKSSEEKIPDQIGDLCACSPRRRLRIEDLRPCRPASTSRSVLPSEHAGLCQGVEPIAMSHVLPPHNQLDIRFSEGQNIFQKLDQHPHTGPLSAQLQSPPRGRKRRRVQKEEPSTPMEPRRRRRRRSHEACARCRNRKIKVGISHDVDHLHVVASPVVNFLSHPA